MQCHKTNKKAKDPLIFRCRNLKDSDYPLFESQLNEVDWSNCLCDKSPDEAFNLFSETITECLDIIKPEHEIKISPKRVIRELWITPGIIKSSSQLSNLYKSAHLGTNTAAIETYKLKRNILNKLSRKSKTQYFIGELAKHMNNSKKLWKFINVITGKPNFQKLYN